METTTNRLFRKCIEIIDNGIKTSNSLSMKLTLNNVVAVAYVMCNVQVDAYQWMVFKLLERRFDLTEYDRDVVITSKIYNKSLRKYEREW